MEIIHIIFILLFVTLSILLIAIYVYVFDINNVDRTKSSDLLTLGLESMDTESYLIQGKTIPNTLLTFYEKPSLSPYIDIHYQYTNSPVNLNFYIYNDSDSSVYISQKTIKDINNFKVVRLYFRNTTSNYYTIKYTLDDNINNYNNIKLSKIALNV